MRTLEVVGRIFFYSLLNRRAFLEEEGKREEIENLIESPIYRELTGNFEEDLLHLYWLPPLKWGRDDLKKCFWLSERIGVLLWGINFLGDIPPFDTPFDIKILDDGLVKLFKNGKREEIVLRSRKELIKFYEIVDFYSWRCGMFMMKKRGVLPPPPYTYESMFKMIMDKAFKSGIVEKNDFGDVIVFSKVFDEIDEDEFFHVAAITKERETAIKFLIEK